MKLLNSCYKLPAHWVGICIGLLALTWITQPVLAVIFPEYLKNGRTYDQEMAYMQWTGSVGSINLYHKDNTSLPPSEGGASCASGCTENVTRIYNGGSVSGNFTYLSTFNVQVAYSGNSGVGTAVIRACGQTIYTENLYKAGSGAPGFNNLPSPAWNVPTAGDCTWSISAVGGYVDFRAVTTVFRTTAAPTVDLKINGGDSAFNMMAPGSYTISWTSTHAAACTASGQWNGTQATQGYLSYANVASGIYTYTLTCTNPAGSASDSVSAIVSGNPTVNITTPSLLTAPATYTASWTSTNAQTCSGYDRFSGLSGLNGSRIESNLGPGVYDYRVRCVNAVGITVSDTKQTTVVAAPTVDVKVDGLDGPTLTRTAPGAYPVSWTSANATQCTGSARLVGHSGTSGSRVETNLPAGTIYDYTVSCQNLAGATASDTVRVNIVAAPRVDVKVNGSDGPLNFSEPAGFNVTWNSTDALSCSALNDLSGPVATNGSRMVSNRFQGSYRYTVQCVNAAGTSVTDTVNVQVVPLPPVVDLTIDGGNDAITREAPAQFTLDWVSIHAVTCTASSSDMAWSGSVGLNGNQIISNVPAGIHTYTLTCTNNSGSASDTVTASVLAPLSGTISLTHSKLVYFASILGLPAQTLYGNIRGGEEPYSVVVHVLSPDGAESIHPLDENPWQLTPDAAGDPDFGTNATGTWRALATIRDSAGRSFQTASVTWDVAWYPVHGRP